MQAESLCRREPSLRIASLRLHVSKATKAEAAEASKSSLHWNLSSFDSCIEAALLGLTSEGWLGHEVFHICEDEIVYSKDEKMSSVELLKQQWPGTTIDDEYFKENPRRATADNTKAKRLLGFKRA